MENLIKNIVAKILWDTQAVKISVEKPFQLASGNFSPIYINCRSLISNPVAMDLITSSIHWWMDNYKIEADIIAGGETAGIPFASYVAQRLSKPMVYVRKQPKGYGMGSAVEGNIKKGQRVLLVEDLITDGGSKESFISGLRAAGSVVEHCMVIFDREQGGVEFLNKMGVTLYSLCSLESAILYGMQTELMNTDSRTEINNYFSDPPKWHLSKGLAFKRDMSK